MTRHMDFFNDILVFDNLFCLSLLVYTNILFIKGTAVSLEFEGDHNQLLKINVFDAYF